MITTLPIQLRQMTASVQSRRAAIGQAVWMFTLIAISTLLAWSMWFQYPQPNQIAWVCFWIGAAAIVYHPRNGVYILVAFALLGDNGLTSWYPFNKNFSSQESLLFFSDGFSFSPLEITIALTFVIWFLRMAFQRKWEFRRSALLVPIFLFTGFAAFGLAYGLGRGGDRVIGLWEARAIFYILPVTLMASGLLQTREDVRILLWAVAIPTAIDGIFGALYVANQLNFQLAGVERIGEHSLSIHFNAFFVLLLASWMYRGSWPKRLVLPLFLPFVLLSYIANNRRASFISLGIALVIFAIVMYRRYPQRFWLVVPPLAVLGLAYVAAFWSVDGPLGAPAQAVRSVIGEPDPRDASSNLYRTYENTNIIFTIKTSPLLGVGFGQKFHIVIPMADISTFPWWEYIPHNSVLYIWMKTGVGGFFALLFMVGMAIAVASKTLWHMPNDDMGVAALLALCYIVMHFVFAYVDMSWDGPNMVMIGTMMGLAISLVPIVATQPALPAKRWVWQRDPQPLPGLVQMRGERP